MELILFDYNTVFMYFWFSFSSFSMGITSFGYLYIESMKNKIIRINTEENYE